jgi:hypothetical protein
MLLVCACNTLTPAPPIAPPLHTPGDPAPLAQENPDLFKWLTGQLPPSQEMLSNPVYVVSP